MKSNIGKYQEVTTLPKTALTVKEYAAQLGVTTAAIYKQIERGTATFKIVTFQTINFIIPE